MRAIRAERLDSIADYAPVELPTPSPGPGEVLVEVAVCGVGYVDSLVSLGRYQVKPALPHVPGQEVGGRVAALGEGVAGFAVGDRVMAAVRGGFAQFALAPAELTFRIPPVMSFAPAPSSASSTPSRRSATARPRPPRSRCRSRK